MSHLIEKRYAETASSGAWLGEILLPFDVVAALSAKLHSAWDVEREVDPAGELAIVVVPTCGNPARLSFVLYEQDGLARVATIIGEAWESSREYPTCQHAVAAIVAAAVLAFC